MGTQIFYCSSLRIWIGELLDTIRSLRGELNKYKDNSVMDRLDRGKLESENLTLKKQNTLFRSIIEENGLAHLLRQMTRSRDEARQNNRVAIDHFSPIYKG